MNPSTSSLQKSPLPVTALLPITSTRQYPPKEKPNGDHRCFGHFLHGNLPQSLYVGDRLPGRGRPIAGDREQLAARRLRETFRAGSGIPGGALNKETVQNIVVFRSANGFIEPFWNCHHIDHVQLTVAESVGVEHRGTY